jgi:hypothetical protein
VWLDDDNKTKPKKLTGQLQDKSCCHLSQHEQLKDKVAATTTT